MVATFFNWIWALVTISITGFMCAKAYSRFIGNTDDRKLEPDVVIALGIMFVTWFSEVFSLFYRVGLIATVVLGFMCLVIIAVYWKELFRIIKGLKNTGSLFGDRGVAIIVLGFFFMIVSTLKILHPDTHLYHAQTIEWIENYGVTKGLGNFFPNLAYNSSFFCLQALFSWKGIVGQSMHGMNAFLSWLAVTYAMFSFRSIRAKRIVVSDILRVTTVLYVFYILNMISSPNSDCFPTLFNLYIVTKCAEIAEDENEVRDIQRIDILSLLGILAVFNVSAKLSFAPFAILILYPFVWYLKKNRISKVVKLLLLGTITLLPFFARNVILSGYLVYPLSSLDLFNVDWKMPAELVRHDGLEIMAWARGMTSSDQYNAGIITWLPVWWEWLDLMCQVFILFAFFMIPFMVVRLVSQLAKKRIDYCWFLNLISLVSFAYWFLTAPSTRYGMPYSIILATMFCLWNGEGLRKTTIFVTTVFSFVMIVGSLQSFPYRECPFILPQDYGEYRYETGIITSSSGDEIEIYFPAEEELDLQPTYSPFPVMMSGNGDQIELRGDSLAEGFRHK